VALTQKLHKVALELQQHLEPVGQKVLLQLINKRFFLYSELTNNTTIRQDYSGGHEKWK
jgi:hypothetical protein